MLSSKIKMTAAVSLLLAAATPLALAADAATSQFLTQAIQGNLGEVRTGALAREKGTTAGVRDLGAVLEKDHTAANEKAVRIAKTLGIKAPSQPGPEQKAMYDSLKNASGAEFDQKFLQSIVEHHEKEIAAYQQQLHQPGAAGSEPVATYARDTMIDLQRHMQTALGLQGKGTLPATATPR